MKPSEMIDQALTDMIPTAEHWGQGHYTRYDDRGGLTTRCLVGSLMAVENRAKGQLLDKADAEHYDPDALLQVRLKAQDFIFDVINEGVKEGYVAPSAFNDARGRTYEEVCAVMEKAKAGLQERGE